MRLTVKIKLLPTVEHSRLIGGTAREYIRTVNQIVGDMVLFDQMGKLSSKNVSAALPSALRCQCVLDGKSIFKKYRKTGKQPVLKKPVAIWNNQNWKLSNGLLSFPVWQDGKSRRIEVHALLTEYQREQLGGKLGTLRITEKSGKWIAQIAVDVPCSESAGPEVMGIDLGLKVPAVAVTSSGRTLFAGNGRENKYIKRRFRSRRTKLGKAKKLNAIRKSKDKEQRWMKDRDHKTSRQLVNLAIAEGVGFIRMEKLSGIRRTARTSRKNEKNLHSWSFYRLAQYIEYKANLAGILVEYVDPAYTSQTCPICGTRNKAQGRDYRCGCGYHTHRDRLGALNIMAAPVADGNSLPA